MTSNDIDAAQVDRMVMASIRPEAIHISLTETQGYQQATLEHSQPTGSETILFQTIGTGISENTACAKAGR